jgi:hypothetical protein
LNARGNKERMVKYLNSTVEMLIKDNWTASKNQFATNTIAFIDSTLNCDGIAVEKREMN